MALTEICCGSYCDCLAAEKGGATRVELNSALHLGGLTPSMATAALTLKNTSLKVIAMLRPRGAGFDYSDEDFETMLLDAKMLLECGVHGLAFGILNPDRTIDKSRCEKIISIVKSFGSEKEAVLHRAFDLADDVFSAMEVAAPLGFDRILTSGKGKTAIDGQNVIKALQEKSAGKIEILAGSGLRAENVAEFLSKTGVKQVHSSCKSWLKDATTSAGEVDYSFAERQKFDVVDEAKVRAFVEAAR